MFTLLIAIGIMALVEAFACSEEEPEPVGAIAERLTEAAIRETAENIHQQKLARRRQRYAERKQEQQSDAR